MTQVKICGITNLEDALLASDLGADEIGFNFYEKSRRYISPADAKVLVSELTRPIRKIGVFVNASAEDILFARELGKLDAVQLHGDETPQFVSEVRMLTDTVIMKAVRVRLSSDIADIDRFGADAILLDTYMPEERGGTGETFNWNVAKEARGKVQRIYLAGGLSPINVTAAIRMVRPYAVDVASGIESEPGKKDPKKLKAFIENAKNA